MPFGTASLLILIRAGSKSALAGKTKKLRLQIRDNGPGLLGHSPAGFKPGVGIATTRARLEQLYGADHQFEMIPSPEGGMAVTLCFPAREQPMTEQE